MIRPLWRCAWALALLLPLGCAQDPLTTAGVDPPEDALVADGAVDEAATDAADPVDAAPFPVRRLPCVGSSSLATDLPSEVYGALEGELVSIVPPGTKGCPADADHLHVQVVVGSKRYDVALTIDSDTSPPLALHVKVLPPGLVEPGWALDSFDYEKHLGVPSADYTPLTRAALLTRLTSELSTASRVRIFGRAYADGSGTHNVHRNGRDRDGVVLVHRVAPGGADRAIALRFANQVF